MEIHRLGPVGITFKAVELLLPGLHIGVEALIEIEVAGHRAIGHHGVGGVAVPLEHLGQHQKLVG
jgi:hypothetical protein